MKPPDDDVRTWQNRRASAQAKVERVELHLRKLHEMVKVTEELMDP